MPFAEVRSLDHIVLTVADVEATKSFYVKYLGMEDVSFRSPKDTSQVRHALKFGDQKINLHKSGAEFEPKAQNVMPGSADLCFLTHLDVRNLIEEFKRAGINVLEGGEVVERIGARGNLRSFYIRDPDLNLVEISNYVEDST